MRLMIDTNIILDVLLEREPFYPASKQILTMCEEKKIYGYIYQHPRMMRNVRILS